jgi:ATP-dependent DNA helicase Q1
MPDLLKVLALPPLTDGRGKLLTYHFTITWHSLIAANRSGTVFFTAPLYRPNLHYSVLPKPANARAAIDGMADWILQNHQYVRQ